MDFLEIAQNAKESSLKLANLSADIKNLALENVANSIEKNKEIIMSANAEDLIDYKRPE